MVINKTQRNSSNYPDTFQDGNKTLCVQTEITDGFNNFFVGKGPSLASNIPSCDCKIHDYLGESNNHSMYL